MKCSSSPNARPLSTSQPSPRMSPAEFGSMEGLSAKSRSYRIGKRVNKLRIMPKQLKARDGHYSLVGRYTHILFDGSPMVMTEAKKEAEQDKTMMKIGFFRINDFYSHAQEYRKSIDSQVTSDTKKAATARKIAILREEGN